MANDNNKNDNGVPAWMVGIGTLVAAVVAAIALTAGDDPADKASPPPPTVTTTATATATATVTVSTPGGQGTTRAPTSAAPPAKPAPALFSSGGYDDSYPLDAAIDVTTPTWNDAYGEISDYAIKVTQKAVTGLGGMYIVRVAGGTDSYWACRGTRFVKSTLSWKDLPSGSSACFRQDNGRVGSFSVSYELSDDGLVRDFHLDGQVWKPTR